MSAIFPSRSCVVLVNLRLTFAPFACLLFPPSVFFGQVLFNKGADSLGLAPSTYQLFLCSFGAVFARSSFIRITIAHHFRFPPFFPYAPS